MKILLITFYYPPDLSAGSFRSSALVTALRDAAPSTHIDIVTTLPNRYNSFSADAPEREEHPGVSIQRIALRGHQSGMIDQTLSFLGFARAVRARTRHQKYDLVFATSSRLMTAVLGASISRRTQSKLYLDIRDIFADNVRYLFSPVVAFFAHRVFSLFERYAITRADKVNVVSGGFLDYFRDRYPQQSFSCFTNGIDEEFLVAGVARKDTSKPSPRSHTLNVLYAGNIGEGQGLHLIVPAVAKRMGDRIHFRIVGDGGRKMALVDAVQAAGSNNVEIIPPVNRAELIAAYGTADILFLHLNDFPAFEKVLPSKLFEYAASGKPVWAGVSGFAARFVETEITNSAVFPPCDVEEALRSLEKLEMQDLPRTEFVNKYRRTDIAKRLAEDILSLVPSEAHG